MAASYSYKKNKKGKTLHSQAKQIILNVYGKLVDLNPNKPVRHIVDLVSDLTGISAATVYRIRKELKERTESNPKSVERNVVTKINKENHHPSNGCTQSHDHSYVKNNSVEIKQFSHLISRSVENLLECKSANQKVDDTENEQNSQCQNNLKSIKEEFHRCSICGKKYLSLINLFVHKYKFCKARLTRINLLKRLLKLKLSMKRKYQCNLCERSFFNESYLKCHLFMHIGKRPFNCKLRFKSFYVNSYLQNHKKIHTEEKISQNKTCDRNFNFDSYLDDYEEHNGETELFYCQICRKTFQTETALIRHGISHSKEKFHCDICNKNFRYKSAFERHRSTHSKVTSFQCNFCEKAFKIHSKLITHLKIHSEYKPFQFKV